MGIAPVAISTVSLAVDRELAPASLRLACLCTHQILQVNMGLCAPSPVSMWKTHMHTPTLIQHSARPSGWLGLASSLVGTISAVRCRSILVELRTRACAPYHKVTVLNIACSSPDKQGSVRSRNCDPTTPEGPNQQRPFIQIAKSGGSSISSNIWILGGR